MGGGLRILRNGQWLWCSWYLERSLQTLKIYGSDPVMGIFLLSTIFKAALKDKNKGKKAGKCPIFLRILNIYLNLLPKLDFQMT